MDKAKEEEAAETQVLSQLKVHFIKKAQIDTTVAAGIVSPQDAAEFIDLTREQTQILKVIRVETGIRKSLNLDTLTLGEPVVVAGQEGI